MAIDLEKCAEVVKAYYGFRGYKFPDALDSVCWLATEVGELLDAVMNGDPEWVRNNPEKARSVEAELGDVLMMAIVVLINSRHDVKAFKMRSSKMANLKASFLFMLSSVASLIGEDEDINILISFWSLSETFNYIQSIAAHLQIDPTEAMLSKMRSKGFVWEETV